MKIDWPLLQQLTSTKQYELSFFQINEQLVRATPACHPIKVTSHDERAF